MKRLVILFNVLFIAFICPLVTLRANAATTLGEYDFTDIHLPSMNNTYSSGDYYLFCVWGSSSGQLYYGMLVITDNSDEVFSLENPYGKLYCSIADDPNNCKFIAGDKNSATTVIPNTSYTMSWVTYRVDYNDWKYASYNYHNYNFVFDNLNVDGFPVHNTNYYPHYIIASNVDIYSYTGVLLQEGNYDDLINYFGNNLTFEITDFTNSEPVTEPTTAEPTTKDNSSEQLEVSNSILENIKTVVSSLANLAGNVASKIAESLGLNSLFDWLWDKISSIPDLILDGLKALFVPSDNLFLDLIDLIKSKFGFVFQIAEITDFILHENFDDVAPDSSVTFKGNKWFGSFTVQIMDWSVIEPYRNLIKNLSLAVSWYFFIRKLQKRFPDIINGTSDGGGKKE